MYKCSKLTVYRSEAHRRQYKRLYCSIGLIIRGGMLERLIVHYTASLNSWTTHITKLYSLFASRV